MKKESTERPRSSAALPRTPSPSPAAVSNHLRHPVRSLRTWRASHFDLRAVASDPSSSTEPESHPSSSSVSPQDTPETPPKIKSLGKRSLQWFFHTSFRGERSPSSTKRAQMALDDYNEVMRMQNENLSRLAIPLPREWREQDTSDENAKVDPEDEDALLTQSLAEWVVYHKALVEF